MIYQYETSTDGKQLENPDRFPQSYKECEEYFGDMREHNGKFCWVVKVSAIGTFKDLRDDLYPWNAKNRGWVTFDSIKARRVSRLGWFENFHLDIHNLREFRDYLTKKLEELGHTLTFDVFKQKVLSNAKTNREIARALILDVDVTQLDIATDALLSIEFDGQYTLVRFHPFIKQKTIPEQTVRLVIKSHKEYMDKTLKMTVQCTKNVHDPIVLIDGTTTTLTKLFLLNLINRQRYIHSTSEVRGELTVLYYDKHSAHMITWVNEAKKRYKTNSHRRRSTMSLRLGPQQ